MCGEGGILERAEFFAVSIEGPKAFRTAQQMTGAASLAVNGH
jgi:hypothetical protein